MGCGASSHVEENPHRKRTSEPLEPNNEDGPRTHDTPRSDPSRKTGSETPHRHPPEPLSEPNHSRKSSRVTSLAPAALASEPRPPESSDSDSEISPKDLAKYRKSFAHSSFAAVRTAAGRLRSARWKLERAEVLGEGGVGRTSVAMVRVESSVRVVASRRSPQPQPLAADAQSADSPGSNTQEIIAVKSLTIQPNPACPELFDRIRADLRTLRKLSHVNLCHVISLGELSTSSAEFQEIAMEKSLVNGENSSKLTLSTGARPNFLGSASTDSRSNSISGSQPLQIEVGLEYIDGGNLVALVGSTVESTVLEVVVDVVKALRQLQAHSISHLNIAPGNVLLTEGRFCLADAGIAALFQSVPPEVLHRDYPKYRTISHFPPEYLERGAITNDMTEKVDVWGLGALCYKLYFGREPFVNGLPDPAIQSLPFEDLRQRILTCDLDFPRGLSPDDSVSPELREVLRLLLHKDPSQRPSLMTILVMPTLRKAREATLRSMTSSPVPSSSNSSGAGTGRPLARAGSLGVGFVDAPKQRFSRSTDNPLERDAAVTLLSINSDESVHHSTTVSASVESIPAVNVDVAFLAETVRCCRCTADVKPLAFRCLQCHEYILCANCYVEEGDHHTPSHTFQSYVVDEITKTQAEDTFGFGVVVECEAEDATPETGNNSPEVGSLLSSERRCHSPRSIVMLNAQALTEHERAVFSMSGHLPSQRLDISKRRSTLNVDLPEQLLTPEHTPTAHRRSRVFSTDSALSDRDRQGSGTLVQASKTPKNKKIVRIFMKAEDVDAHRTVDDLVEECRRSSQTELLLIGKQLAAVPGGILEGDVLGHLTLLDLATNRLSSIPTTIASLTSLRKLCLANNELTSLPDTIGDLAQLESLDVNHNRLTDLPMTLMFADALVTISMDYNHCTALPAVAFEISGLSSLYIAANKGISQWPELEVLQHPVRLTIGIDNEPSLERAFAKIEKEVPRLTVQWNKVYPDEIIPSLYCGSLRSAQSPHVYDALRIGSVLTVGRGLEPIVTPTMTHKTIIVDDIDGATIDNQFEEAVHFIEESLRSGRGCLVHCFAGMSRSATTIIAYLMIKRGMRMDEAYLKTKAGRPAIYPNQGFFKQLLALDAKLHPGSVRPLDLDSLQRHVIP